jgi:hypothetical protein
VRLTPGVVAVPQAALWEPTDLGADLIAWWSADDLVDGAVTTWTDSIGSLAPTQGTAANRPVRAATSFNSAYPGVTFDGTNDRLRIASTGLLPVGTNSSDIYVVTANDEVGTVATVRYAFGSGAATSNAGRILGRVGISNVNRYRITTSTSATTLTDTSVDLSGPHILGAQFAAGTITGWIDGNATSPASASTAFDSVATETAIGATTSGGANFWLGVTSDIFVTAPLSVTNRQKLEGWAAWNRGLTGNLDVSHPYKSAPPTV